MIFCFLPRQLSTTHAKTVCVTVLPAESDHMIMLPAGSMITWTDSAGSHLSCTTVSARWKRSQTVSVEAKYDGQSRQKVKIGGLVYNLCTIKITKLKSPNIVLFILILRILNGILPFCSCKLRLRQFKNMYRLIQVFLDCRMLSVTFSYGTATIKP